MTRRQAGSYAVAVLLGLTLLLGGCSVTQTCVSWVDFKTPQDAYDDAMLVVIGTVTPTSASATLFGVTVPVYAVDVEDVVKGDPPENLTVAPTPVTCTGGSPEPDPLATDDRLILLLTNTEGVWRPLTPLDGVIEQPEGDPLPFDR